MANRMSEHTYIYIYIYYKKTNKQAHILIYKYIREYFAIILSNLFFLDSASMASKRDLLFLVY